MQRFRPKSYSRGLSILILDDDRRFLETFEDLLVQDGHAVYPATRGFQAVEIVRRVPIEVGFLDFDLPDLGGVETLAEIRRERPELPAIFVSGNPSLELERLVLDGGGFALLRKPFDPGQLRVVLREVIIKVPKRHWMVEKESIDGKTQDPSSQRQDRRQARGGRDKDQGRHRAP